MMININVGWVIAVNRRRLPPRIRNSKKVGDRMSIFDYFTSKPADEQERKSFSPNSYKKLFSDLDAKGDELKAQHPDDGKKVDHFIKAVKDAYKARCKKAPDGNLQLLKAKACFFLTTDRMSAYACLLPPENGGEALTLEEFLEDMRYEGINYGILQEEIPQELACGYFRIFPIARGTSPKAGEDGKVTELFQRNKTMCLEIQNEGQVDFSQDIPLQPVRKGAVICLIRPAKPGTDGMDVTGRELPCPQAVSANIPQGENTVISRGGQALTADVDGILYIQNDLFCIHEQKIIDGDVDQFHGVLQISGNLYIGGNVDGGVNIEASGDIVINGKLGQARVISMGGTIHVQQGIYGTSGKTFLSAARHVQSPVIEWAEITAGANVVAEMISNSTIHCEDTVYALTGRGMITGSVIRAGDSILCLRVGNLAGDRSQFSVGYPPHTPESWHRVKTELAEVQSTIKKLWANISDLRKKGSRISDVEKSVLDQLVVQRNLYIEKRDGLTSELACLDKILDKKSTGRIKCEKLYPYVTVRIGRLTEEITTAEENCNIHIVGNRMLLK
ncbi:MAG: FapA family protein [Oscillospiraceae bacterium]|nr:FapA family protein [Oscillospiraceae bacterium]